MKLLDSVKTWFAGAAAQPPLPPPAPEPEAEEFHVPELAPATLRAALHGDAPPLLLDVREPYEWRQVRIPGAHHIPMNSVPQHLAELPIDRPIVVYCAHGSRSFGVAHYLREHGFDASNLTGGITQWHIQGGEVEVQKG